MVGCCVSENVWGSAGDEGGKESSSLYNEATPPLQEMSRLFAMQNYDN